MWRVWKFWNFKINKVFSVIIRGYFILLVEGLKGTSIACDICRGNGDERDGVFKTGLNRYI